MASYRISAPMSKNDVLQLHIGDEVLISGTIYTARDSAHKRIIDMLNNGKELPFKFDGAIIYYVGPSPSKPGNPIGSAGPTTSYRMDPYTPTLLANGLKGMIGKGARNDEVAKSMQKYGAVYFAATGGAAALIAKSIVSAEIIAFPELMSEAVRKLVVKDLPAIVAQDSYGGNIYKEGIKKYRKT